MEWSSTEFSIESSNDSVKMESYVSVLKVYELFILCYSFNLLVDCLYIADCVGAYWKVSVLTGNYFSIPKLFLIDEKKLLFLLLSSSSSKTSSKSNSSIACKSGISELWTFFNNYFCFFFLYLLLVLMSFPFAISFLYDWYSWVSLISYKSIFTLRILHWTQQISKTNINARAAEPNYVYLIMLRYSSWSRHW